jgi:eukaryotic-like serine/threonine-protein kinase
MQTIGRYELLEQIGAGGAGLVYRARDPVADRQVALKLLRVPDAADPSALERVLEEARIAARLVHPNIASMHEVGVEDGQPYLAMELLEGRSLRELIAQSYPFKLAQKLHVAAQIARALAHAHQHEVLHRDVRPENVRVLKDGTVRLQDFSAAPPLSAAEAIGAPPSSPAARRLPYLSPEQLRGEPLSPASDVFSFGTLLYELLTYERPFQASGAPALVRQIADPSAPEPDVGRLPEGLRELVLGCLKRSEPERFQSLEPIASELLRIRDMLRADRLPSILQDAPEPPAAGAKTPVPAARSSQPQRPAAAEAAAAGPPKVFLRRAGGQAARLREPPPRRGILAIALRAALALLLLAGLGLAALAVLRPEWALAQAELLARAGRLLAWQAWGGGVRAPAEPDAEPAPRAEAAVEPTARPQRPAAAPATPSPPPPDTASAAGDAPLAGATIAPRWVAGRPAVVPLPGGQRLELLWVPAGTLQMGCSPADPDCAGDESPVFPVEVEGFWLGRHEVTRTQWAAVLGGDPGEEPRMPATRVTWREARRFLDSVGHGLRLPTEAEWEHAARAGTTGPAYRPVAEAAWTVASSGSRVHRVGELAPNAFGLYDMLGNVWEWCENRYAVYPEGGADPAAQPGEKDFAVLRGGSALRGARYSRASARYAAEASHSAADIGLRVARPGP